MGIKHIADSSFLSELNAVENILMVGYPNGLWDSKNNLPLFRTGITATPPFIDYEHKPEFIIDCACFTGSSGSPIFLVNEGSYSKKGGGITIGNRFKLLGVLYAGPQQEAEGDIKIIPIPTVSKGKAIIEMPINLGYCIKADQLLYFENYFQKQANQ